MFVEWLAERSSLSRETPPQGQSWEGGSRGLHLVLAVAKSKLTAIGGWEG